MASPSRRILEIKPGQTWLVIADGAWAVDAPPEHSAVPLARSVGWLLPLVERQRDQVESRARAHLDSADPDFGEVLCAVIERGLTAWSDHWISHTLGWMRSGEFEQFAARLLEIATAPTPATQATQHTAKQLMKKHGVWPPHETPS